MSERHDGIDEAMLHAYVDDRLSAADRARVEAFLQRDAGAALRVAAWQQQTAALRGHFAPLLDEPVPQAMLAALHRRPAGPWQRAWQTTRRQMPRIAALLVVAVLGVGLGWWGRGALPSGAGTPLPREAARAHLIYTAEVLHPVEVVAAEEKHLVAWLSKRLGTQLKVPQLAEAGFNLVGGRLLPASGPAAASGVAAQFMYENKRGERLTLYVRAGESGTDTAFHFSEQKGAAGFYWVDGGYGYALLGGLERSRLLPIARAVYEQLN